MCARVSLHFYRYMCNFAYIWYNQRLGGTATMSSDVNEYILRGPRDMQFFKFLPNSATLQTVTAMQYVSIYCMYDR